MRLNTDLKHTKRYEGGSLNMVFYVRFLSEKVPEGKKLNFKEDRNYPVLGVDAQGGKILVPDNENKLLWLPMGLFRFVKLS